MARKGMVTFDVEACKGCELCVNECGFDVLEMSLTVNKNGYNYPIVKIANNCTACTGCAIICPDSVVTVYRGK